MSTLAESIFRIDYNTEKLIYLFKSKKHLEIDYDELRWMTSQLNEYQYLYLLNEIVLDIELTLEILNLFCSFIYKTSKYTETEGQEILQGAHLKFKRTDIENHIFPSYEQGVLELLRYNNYRLNKSLPLVRSIRKKLLSIEKKYEKLEPCILKENHIEEDEYGYPLGEHGQSFLDAHSIIHINKIAVIRNESYFWFDTMYLSVTNTSLIKKTNTLVEKLKLLYIENTKHLLNYKLQTVYPLVFSTDNWKKMIYNYLKNCKELSEFHSRKTFFKECIRDHISISGSEYLNTKYHKANEGEAQEYKVGNDIIDLKKMINWIDQTFISVDNINYNEDFKFIDEIADSNKLILCEKMNQKILLKILIRYFETNNLEYNKNKLHSLVLHFTTIEETGKKSGYTSKFLPFTRLEYTDFIPENHTSNIIKIFLKMLDKGIIKTKINKTFVIIELMFSKNDVQGFKKDTAKYYWKNKGEKGIGLKIDNSDFWDFFLRQLPN